jgi:hypothetical protein
VGTGITKEGEMEEHKGATQGPPQEAEPAVDT